MRPKKKFEKLKVKILYVEDEKIVRESVAQMMSRRVEKIYVAEDGGQGLKYYHQYQPEIVITDINMPVLNGLEMLKIIRAENPDIPVIITSAHSDSKYFLQAIDIGIEKFAMKPVDNRELFKLVQKIYKQLNYERQILKEKSQRIVAQSNLRESQAQLQAIFDNVVVGMGIISSDLKIVFSNQTLAEMLNEDENSVLGHSLEEYLIAGSDTLAKVRELAEQDYTGQAINSQSEELLHVSDELEFWVDISISGIISKDRKVSKFAVVINDIDERIQSQNERDTLYNSLITELETAASVQSFFLPNWLCVEDDLLFSNNYTPSTNVGGDLFDLIKLKDRKYLLYIGDISGHGVQSALIMTAVKSTIKMLVENSNLEISPCEMVNQLNTLLSKDVFVNNYLTLLLGVIDADKKEFRFFNAGHPPIIRYCKKRYEVEVVESSGSIPIGWMHDFEYHESEENVITLDEYSSYIFYTDGIFECENDRKEELGIDGFTLMLKNYTEQQSTLMLPYVVKKMILDGKYDISGDDFTLLSLNLRRDLNDNIRYYMVDPQRDNTGDIGKHCEDFLKAKNINCLAFPTELLVNEYLNKIMEHNSRLLSENIILVRLRMYPDSLQITFWDKGDEWELPEYNEKDNFLNDPDNLSSSTCIIRNLSDKIEKRRFIDVNETIFYLYYQKE